MKYIKVIAKTKAKKENIIQKSENHFEINVKEKAEKNMANKRIIELLSVYFDVPFGKIRIVNGHHHPHKLLVLED